MRRLFNRQPGEVTQLDEVGFDGVYFGKPVECFVERLEIVAEFGNGQLDVVKVLAHPTAAVLGASFAASVLHEDPPHDDAGAVARAN